ncbi:hypothetical protein GCM10010872_33050 [Dyella flava]|nr:hypothetical protein GCM10010872_33050 [Dyella flava]
MPETWKALAQNDRKWNEIVNAMGRHESMVDRDGSRRYRVCSKALGTFVCQDVPAAFVDVVYAPATASPINDFVLFPIIPYKRLPATRYYAFLGHSNGRMKTCSRESVLPG